MARKYRSDQFTALKEESYSLVDPAEIIGRKPGKWKAIAEASDHVNRGVNTIRRRAQASVKSKKVPYTNAALSFAQDKISSSSKDILAGKTSAGKIFRDSENVSEFAQSQDISLEEARNALKEAHQQRFTGIDKRQLGNTALIQDAQNYDPSQVKVITDKAGKSSLQFFENKDKNIKNALGQNYDVSLKNANGRVIKNHIDWRISDAFKRRIPLDDRGALKVVGLALKDKKITAEKAVELRSKVHTAFMASLHQRNKIDTLHDTFKFNAKISQGTSFRTSIALKEQERVVKQGYERKERSLRNGNETPQDTLAYLNNYDRITRGQLPLVSQYKKQVRHSQMRQSKDS